MKPVFKRKQILVADNSGEEVKSEGGLIVSTAYTEPEYQTKEVIYSGEKCEDYKRGDTIYFKRVVAEKIKLNGKNYLLIPDEGLIYCKLEKEDAVQ